MPNTAGCQHDERIDKQMQHDGEADVPDGRQPADQRLMTIRVPRLDWREPNQVLCDSAAVSPGLWRLHKGLPEAIAAWLTAADKHGVSAGNRNSRRCTLLQVGGRGLVFQNARCRRYPQRSVRDLRCGHQILSIQLRKAKTGSLQAENTDVSPRGLAICRRMTSELANSLSIAVGSVGYGIVLTATEDASRLAVCNGGFSRSTRARMSVAVSALLPLD